jgi:DNA-binding IclR family transcriptional regulator
MANDTTPQKMLRIFDLIEDSPDPVSTDVMLEQLGLSRSTLYRFLKNLMEAGFISSIPKVGFTFGPRISELDYQMRQRDSLISASRPVLVELAKSERGLAMLCRRYRDRVVCVHQEQGDLSFRSNYERGMARTLFRGAASRIILAYLGSATINQLFAQFPVDFAEAGLGKSLAEARETLRHMRQHGWDITHAQVTQGVTGIAVPLFDLRGEILGSLSLTIKAQELAQPERQRLVERVQFCAAIIRQSIQH